LIGLGAQQEFRNCADIRILPNPSDSNVPEEEIIKPPVPPQKIKPVFQCETWKSNSENKPGLVINTKPDLNKYTGIGVICWNRLENVWDDKYLFNQHIEMCTNCFLNCLTADKICPKECICRCVKKYGFPCNPKGVANGSPCISGATESVGINGTSGTGGGGGSNGTNGTQQQEDRLLHILD
ncbi:hypothetical protein BpHYR1_008888, partial [Brachionus plicatilis]